MALTTNPSLSSSRKFFGGILIASSSSLSDYSPASSFLFSPVASPDGSASSASGAGA